MTLIFKRFSIKNTRKATQALLRIFSIETFKSNCPLGRQLQKLVCPYSRLMKKIFCLTLILFCFLISSCAFQLRSKADFPTELNTVYLSSDKAYSILAIDMTTLFQSMDTRLVKNQAEAPFSVVISNNYFTYSRPAIIDATQLTTIGFMKRATISIINNKTHKLVTMQSFTTAQSLTLNANQIYTVNSNDIMQQQLNHEMVSLIYYWLISSHTKAALHDANNVKTTTHADQ